MSSIKEKLEELVDLEKVSRQIDLEKIKKKFDLEKIKEYAASPEGKRTRRIVLTVLAIVGAVILAAAIAYWVHRYFTPVYTDDDDDFEEA